MRRILTLVALLCAISTTANAQSITTFEQGSIPVTAVEGTYFLALEPWSPGPGLRMVWDYVEECMMMQRDINEVKFYLALAIMEADTLPSGLDGYYSLWGVYYEDPPEIILTMSDIIAVEQWLQIAQHEIAHHFMQMRGDTTDHHDSPLFLTCSGEEN